MILDWNVIILAVIASIPATLVAVGALIKILIEVRATRHLVNGHMTKMLELTKMEATATAVLGEKEAEQARQEAKSDE